MNLPGALAELRHESWKAFSWPRGLATLFDRAGVAVAAGLALAFAALSWTASSMKPEREGLEAKAQKLAGCGGGM